jgi:hypothetical protein
MQSARWGGGGERYGDVKVRRKKEGGSKGNQRGKEKMEKDGRKETKGRKGKFEEPWGSIGRSKECEWEWVG